MDETEQLLKQVAGRARSSHQGRYAAAGKPTEPLPAPLDSAGPRRAEARLGFALPPLLAALYTRVADGGFGPEYGLLPLERAVAEYASMRGSAWRWPEGVLPIADFGCAMRACVDCRSETAQVLLFEPNSGDPGLAWFLESPGLADWLRGWLDGTAWFSEESGAGEEWDLELTTWADFGSRV
ncbi:MULTISPECIES: SMI1/KNR4 family protein [unclassified Streptomyces]|uniref:SMI1/KNR4 family protein n=1 Tax=unclassified Streptomyces TaxID=2593676 RepID=UPI000DC78E6D|nr:MULTISPECIES: SMI1/KNR4 family protein [unclassified Streptomyces]AWZ06977.1 SMI1/KNR4 family protein [Streptomyces sp. ICC4]AWZ15573.1 SMI1/KNR4 family protein [Streptomyces sp. ICC1]